MVTPTTWTSAFILLLLSLFCLGSWPNAYKRTGRWRFELFSCDFALGALVFSLIAAFTLGTLGAALGFSDRMLVAGRTNEALAVIAGGCFALANMLFLSSVSLLGMAAAFPLTIGTACGVAALLLRGNNWVLLLTGIGLLITMAAVEINAAQQRGAELGVAAGSARKTSKTIRVSTKGILSGFIGGLALGGCVQVTVQCTGGELGLGAYAGLLLFSVGLFVSTFVLNFYFMNIAIHGGPISFNAYFGGKVQQHLAGIGGGVAWAAGALALALALLTPLPIPIRTEIKFTLPPLAVLIGMIWGLLVWKEYEASGAAARKLCLAGVFFVGAVVALGMSVAS